MGSCGPVLPATSGWLPFSVGCFLTQAAAPRSLWGGPNAGFRTDSAGRLLNSTQPGVLRCETI